MNGALVEEQPIPSYLDGMEKIESIGSNCDGSYEESVEQKLRDRPNVALSNRPAWEHYDLVWFDGERFHVLVRRYRESVAHFVSTSARAALDAANEQFGAA